MDQRTSGTDIPIGTTRASEINEGRGTTETVKEKAREIGQKATARAQSAVSEQKERATSELGAVAFALRDAATRLDGENMMSGRLIRGAAERLDDFSRRLESRDLDGIVRETRQWARRSPAAFMGAAVAIGFLASRFLKASERPGGMEPLGGYAPDYDPYTATEDYSGLEYSGGSGNSSRGTGFTPGASGYTPGSGSGGSFGGGMTGGGGTDGRS
ncbi:MAG TPA: hypothetical protein VFV54_10465 [Thermoanaerobaculia bacterium]|nr:hypothetical protein [Thermoanaerobaculia bacterium]